jgi:hypothetical protein
MNDADSPEGIEVPHGQLSSDALRGIVEAFVLREGTDYGKHEYSLEEKVAHVMHQLQRGEARIVFDLQAQSPNIVVAERAALRP